LRVHHAGEGLAWIHARRTPETSRDSWLRGLRGLAALVASTAGSLAPAIAYKSRLTSRVTAAQEWLDQLSWFGRVVTSAAQRALGEFGVLLPRTIGGCGAIPLYPRGGHCGGPRRVHVLLC
jgi:hypothetical protein